MKLRSHPLPTWWGITLFVTARRAPHRARCRIRPCAADRFRSAPCAGAANERCTRATHRAQRQATPDSSPQRSRRCASTRTTCISTCDPELPLRVRAARTAAAQLRTTPPTARAPCRPTADKHIQIEFWQRAAKEGFTDERARASAQKFRAEFDALDKRLAAAPYLMGDAVSVLDIAWFIYANRLSLGRLSVRAAASARARLEGEARRRGRSSPRKSRCRRR